MTLDDGPQRDGTSETQPVVETTASFPPKSTDSASQAKRKTNACTWIFGALGFLLGLEVGYQTGIQLAFPLSATAAFVGRTFDTRRIRHWIYYPFVALLLLPFIKVPANRDAAPSYNRGVDALLRQDYDLAISSFSEAIEINPQDPKAFLNRGGARLGKQQFSAAVDDFNKAIELDPNYVKALYNRGLAYLGTRDYQRAIDDCSKAIALDEQCAEAYYTRGMVYEEMGEVASADADFDSAVKINPDLEASLQVH